MIVSPEQTELKLPRIVTTNTIVDRSADWNRRTRKDLFVLGERSAPLSVEGTDHDDNVITSSVNPLIFNLREGNNRLFTRGPAGSLVASARNAIAGVKNVPTTGDIIATAGDGNNNFALLSAKSANVFVGHGNNRITINTGEVRAGNGNNFFQSSLGGSVLSAGSGENQILSVTGNDTIVLHPEGHVTVFGYQPTLTKISLGGIPEIEIVDNTIRVKSTGKVVFTASNRSISPSSIVD